VSAAARGALGLVLLLAAGGAAGAVENDPQLAVEAPAVSWSRDRLELAVEQRGALVDRRLSVSVIVDGNLIRAYPTKGGRTAIVVEGLELEPGAHRVLVKSGTHEARDRFRYLPPAYAAAAAAALAAVLAAVVVVRRRKRRAG
jgi:hypothetical protein